MNFRGMLLHARKRSEQGPTELAWLFEDPLVGGMLARVVPNPLRRVEFRTVRRQLKDLEIAPMFGKPIVDLPLLVIRSVVLLPRVYLDVLA